MPPDDRARTALLRSHAQLLGASSKRSALGVVERLLAVQGQDARGFRLAIRARSVGLRAADVDEGLTTERSMLVTWLNRGTLHLVASTDYPWVHALTAPSHDTANSTRLAQLGISPGKADRGVAAVVRSLDANGPQTREQLRTVLSSAGIPPEDQAQIHVLFRASMRGLVVRGPMVGKQQAFALTAEWLGPPTPVDPDKALAELARRYLEGHGPAGARDLAKWSGLSLGTARRALSAIAGEIREMPGELVDLRSRPRATAKVRPRLLGVFDPVLVGWDDRTIVLGRHAAKVANGGMLGPVALADGRAAGRWSLTGKALVLTPFEPLAPEVLEAFGREAQDITRFLGLPSRPMTLGSDGENR